MFNLAARIVDLLAVAFAIGATLWFFFIQSGALVKKMGRDRFVPIQMALTAMLFKSLSIATGLALVAALIHNPSITSISAISAAVGFTGAIFNKLFVLPRAFRAGGRSLRENQDDEQQKSVARFASDGGGQATRFWHRTVVFFVIVMLGGLIVHAVSLVTNG